MNILEVFFDYECPYCMKGYEYLRKHLPAHPEITVVFRPCEAHPRPEDHPPHTDLAIQGYYFAKVKNNDLHAYNTRLFEAVHKDEIDVENPHVLADYVADLVDRDDYVRVLQDGTYREIQEKGNDYAYEDNDVWFLPAFRMNGETLDAVGDAGVTEEQVSDFLRKAKR